MSRRLYRLALGILPRGFREEFGPEMLQALLDRRESLIGGVAGVIALALRLRIDQWRVDLRHACRSLWRQKTFTVTAAATLALALGPATAVFTLVNGVLLNPLPGARDLDRVVYAWVANPTANRHEFPWSELNFLDHRDRQRSFTALGAFTSTSATIGGEVPQQVGGAWVSEDMFDVLGIAPSRGRRFTADDMQPGAAPTIVLGHDFARTRFPNGDAVGQTIVVDGRPTAIIGVMPAGFRFPAGDPDFWQPLTIDRAASNRGQSYLRVMGRLAPGATPEEAVEQMNAIALDLEKLHPASNSNARVELVPAPLQLTRSTRRIVTVLGFAAAAIFLLACTNVASLMVVRTAGRHGEMAVRTALGASSMRLTGQLLTEHLVLAAVAALAAAVMAAGLLRLLGVAQLVPAAQLERATLGAAEFAFLALLMAATAALLGAVVSRRATRTAAVGTGQRTQSSSREVARLRHALVALEVGATVVLLVAAALLLQSAARVIAVDPGFRRDNVVTFHVGLPMSRYGDPAARVRFIDAVVERLAQVPGVEIATSAAYPPMTSMRATRRFSVEGQPPPPPGTEPLGIDLPAGPGYASVMGLRLLDGRWIDERDRIDSPPVVVISESLARQHFGGARAVGQRLRYYGRPGGPPPPAPEVVGVVADVRQFGMAEASAPQMYVPHAQRAWTFASFFVRTHGDPRSVMSGLPAAVRAVDPERPLERLQTVDELVSSSTSDRRAMSALLALAALVALTISAIGVYGVAASTTAARRRELAIRAAVGADQTALLTLTIRHSMAAACIGVMAGLAGALAVSGVLESLLYEVQAYDPVTYGGAAAGLLWTCGVATYLPARRALRLSPAAALNEP
jgi:predicted permease